MSMCLFNVTNNRCSHLKENNTSDWISLPRSALFHREKRTLFGRDKFPKYAKKKSYPEDNSEVWENTECDK